MTQSTIALNPKVRQLAERIEAMAEKCGVHVSWHHGGVHPYGLFERNGHSRKHTIPSTPSDHRSEDNCLSDVRRMFRDMGWQILEEQKKVATTTNPSFGDAAPVKRVDLNGTIDHSPRPAPVAAAPTPNKMTPPPLSDPRAIHVNGWEVPLIPEIAKGSPTKGRKSKEYVDFVTRRAQWADTVLRSGGRWAQIIEALARAGHETTQGAIEFSLRRRDLRKQTADAAKAKVGNTSTEAIRDKMLSIVDAMIEKKMAIVSAERDALLERVIELESERDDAVEKLKQFKKLLSDV